MGERKVLNKYYPADFDPAKIPRRRQPKNQQMNVRMMLPMSIRCGTCGNYTYKGTKFNSRKEVVVGDSYLGLKIVRFYSKCSNCWAEITFVTDPQNSDYAVESGASRNFEPWRAEDEAREEEKKKRNAEEMGDAMKSLENTTLGSKREIDILAALDELKSMKSRRAKLTVDAMLEALPNYKAEEDEEEEAAYIRAVFLRGQNNTTTRRIIDDQDLDFDHPSPRPLKRNKLVSSSSNQPSVIKFSIIKKSTAQPPSSGLQSLFHHYGSDQDE